MKIITDRPFPLIDKVREKFPIDESRTVFAYGEDLYNPGGGEVSTDLMVHEAIHAIQQVHGAEIWWERYLTDDAFRLAQEVQAYRAQYRFLCAQRKDRNVRSKILIRLAKDLSSPMYGSLCSFADAYKLIKNEEGQD